MRPSVEKFHAPAAERRRITRGSCRRNDSTRRCFDVTSGSSAMPTRTARAVTNGVWPNAGSSAMARSSTTALPENTESEMCPIATSRPSAALIVRASCGRNRSMLINNDAAMPNARIDPSSVTPVKMMSFLRMFSFAWSLAISMPHTRVRSGWLSPQPGANSGTNRREL